MRRIAVFGVVVCTFLFAGSAFALDPDEKCEATKNKEAGKLSFCLQKAEMRLVKTEGVCSVTTQAGCHRDDDCPVSETCVKATVKYDALVARCNAKFSEKWTRAEDKATAAGEACPDGMVDPNSMLDFITAHSDAVAAALAGGGLPNYDCGNGVLDANEDCDWGTIRSGTCVGEGFDGGTLGCAPGACSYDTSGCWYYKKVFLAGPEPPMWHGDLGGLPGADALCQTKAAAAGLSGTFMAWLSDGNVSPDTRFTKHSVPYVLTDGQQIASNWGDLTDGTLDVGIYVFADGTNIGGASIKVASNVDFDGTVDGSMDCIGWTDASTFEFASFGYAAEVAVGVEWSNAGSGNYCLLDEFSIYCFEQ